MVKIAYFYNNLQNNLFNSKYLFNLYYSSFSTNNENNNIKTKVFYPLFRVSFYISHLFLSNFLVMGVRVKRITNSFSFSEFVLDNSWLKSNRSSLSCFLEIFLCFVFLLSKLSNVLTVLSKCHFILAFMNQQLK